MHKKRKALLAIFIIAAISLIYLFWLLLKPVRIIAVHNDENYSAVLVTHFPFTDAGKLAWWHDNKAMLKSRYGIPRPSSDGNFTLTFWLFGEGYMAREKYDRLCFTDIKTDKNCIDKNKIFSVSKGRNTGIQFMVHDGIYRLNDKGEWVKEIFAEK